MKPFTGKDFDHLQFLWVSMRYVFYLIYCLMDNIDESSVTLLLLITERTNRTIILSDRIVKSRQNKRIAPSSF